MMMFWIGAFCGGFVWVPVGVAVAALCRAAKDDQYDR